MYLIFEYLKRTFLLVLYVLLFKLFIYFDYSTSVPPNVSNEETMLRTELRNKKLTNENEEFSNAAMIELYLQDRQIEHIKKY